MNLKGYLEVVKNNLNRLGNLALLNPISNPIVSNWSFDQKKKYYEKDNAEITSSLKTFSEWNHASIELRQKTLAQHAKKVWTLEPKK